MNTRIFHDYNPLLPTTRIMKHLQKLTLHWPINKFPASHYRVQSSRPLERTRNKRTAWPSNMGPILHPETSVTNYQPALRNTVNQQRPDHKPNHNSHLTIFSSKINFNIIMPNAHTFFKSISWFAFIRQENCTGVSGLKAWGNGGTAPRILNLEDKRWVVSFTSCVPNSRHGRFVKHKFLAPAWTQIQIPRSPSS